MASPMVVATRTPNGQRRRSGRAPQANRAAAMRSASHFGVASVLVSWTVTLAMVIESRKAASRTSRATQTRGDRRWLYGTVGTGLIRLTVTGLWGMRIGP